LQREFRLTYIFISHSLPVVAQLATRIAVMRAGKFVEVGAAEQILRRPRIPTRVSCWPRFRNCSGRSFFPGAFLSTFDSLPRLRCRPFWS
jgi:ABC-type sulfate/molybdate transport systems ATPase subunit